MDGNCLTPSSQITLDNILPFLLFSKNSTFESIAAHSELRRQVSDWNELEKARHRIERDLKEGVGAGKGLPNFFPRSLAFLKDRADLTTLMRDFIASAQYDAHYDVPWYGPGISIEESFFQFLSSTFPEVRPIALEEFCFAILQELTIQTDPYFEIRTPEIKKGPAGWFAILEKHNSPYLVAATTKGFVHGTITPLIHGLLENSMPELKIEELNLISQPLAELGLWPRIF